MDVSNLTFFIVASWILIITPGPDMIYVITRGISQGCRAGVVSAIGVTGGILVHTLFAAFGLALILRTSALAFMVVKIIGAIYLLYLGVQTLRNKSDLSFDNAKPAVELRKVFVQGVLTNVLNPKIALFFLAFLPQFIDPSFGSVSLQMVLFGVAFALFGIIFLVTIGYFSGNIGGWLMKRPSFTDKVRWFSGSIFIALGLRLAFLERR